MRYKEYMKSIDKSKILAQTIEFECPKCYLCTVHCKINDYTNKTIVYPCSYCWLRLERHKDRIYIDWYDLKIDHYHPWLRWNVWESYIIPELDFS
jgi:transcription elongation factor Elf1